MRTPPAAISGTTPAQGYPYEQILGADPRRALSEGSAFFEGKSAVQETLRRIAARLTELQIPYAVVGGMALSAHGFVRFTDDVDLLVTAPNLQSIHEKLEGLGYLPPFKGSKQLRDVTSGVKIEFLVTGEFPGDGRPKSVAFPDPQNAFIEIDGIRYLRLRNLVELKLASGISNPSRLKDLADVQELIKILKLPHSFGDELDSYVRGRYFELWDGAQAGAPER